MNSIIYPNLTDHINKSTYRVEVPAYSFQEHSAMTSGELDRFHVPDINQMVLSRLTIADMVDMVAKMVRFKILISADIIEIYKFLNKYMLELDRYTDRSEKASKYLNKCVAFQNELSRNISILANRGIRGAIDVQRKFAIRKYFANPDDIGG